MIRTIKTTGSNYSPDGVLDRESVWELLDQLEPRHREILILKGIHGYTYREIADITGMPMGTVMSSLYYARKNFQKVMGETR
jgi:RNA polymerase sigma-70 factor (ECF subfamily)